MRMQLLLPPQIVSQILDALRDAGKSEIGGIMMGEHVGLNTFRVSEVTIQKLGGTFATFVRLVNEIIGPLKSFFNTTKHNYSQFNYLGEWHSHHSFDLTPSEQDHATMVTLIRDSNLGANFVLLLLVKVDVNNGLATNLTVYEKNRTHIEGTVLQINNQT